MFREEEPHLGRETCTLSCDRPILVNGHRHGHRLWWANPIHLLLHNGVLQGWHRPAYTSMWWNSRTYTNSLVFFIPLLCARSRVTIKLYMLIWSSESTLLGCQAFHSLIIKPFDHQNLTLPWLFRISDTSENQPKRLESDDQINLSRLIGTLFDFLWDLIWSSDSETKKNEELACWHAHEESLII